MSKFKSNTTTARLSDEIRNSAVFTIKDKTSAAYAAARSKLVADVHALILEERGISEDKFADGLELVQAVYHCLDNFDPSKGEFIYFVKSTMRFYVLSRDIEENEIQGHVCSACSAAPGDSDITEDEALDYYVAQNDEDDSDGSHSYNEDYLTEDGVKTVLKGMTAAFNKRQSRSRPMLAVYATGLVYDCLNQKLFDSCDVAQLPFFDRETFETAVRRHRTYSQRELAEMFDRKESNVSRSLAEFRQAIAKECAA